VLVEGRLLTPAAALVPAVCGPLCAPRVAPDDVFCPVVALVPAPVDTFAPVVLPELAFVPALVVAALFAALLVFVVFAEVLLLAEAFGAVI
jgi:hypothetical protein